ncbi:MAG: hypothetical protein STSR0002_14290 [Smithella sp.]|jgi:hypothetical protein
MKRFWLVLLSLGLVMAFSASAFAVDVKVSGEYYAAGMYLDKTNVMDDDTANSTAFFFQRLRVGTDFVVSPCLSLVTRFDAMERIWGGARSDVDEWDSQSAGTRNENENIAFDLLYIKYVSPIGLFEVGYQPDYVWGTVFGNRSKGPTAGQITYMAPIGPVTIVAQYAKEGDNSFSAVNNSYYPGATDRDYDSYRVGAIYNFNTAQAKGAVGTLFLYNRDAENRNGGLPIDNPIFLYYPAGYLTNVYKVIPYFKVKVGPVDLQGEFEYTFGDAIKAEAGAMGPDVDIDAWSVFLDATANFGQFYAGGSFVYLSGDDPGTPDKLEGSNSLAAVNTVGLDWNPCLIMFNTETFGYWVGGVSGHSNTVIGEEMSNVLFFQGRVGVKPTPQLDINLAIAYATADEKPDPYGVGSTFGNGDYGTEIDLTGTYKITNNLSYMLGAGYLFTGDYYEGYGGNNDVDNDFIVLNKLTLSF